jgi:hypothetical protein
MLQAYQLDPSPASAPASTGNAYRYLAIAWDEAQLGHASEARAYLRQGALAGANPIEVRWIDAEIG